MTYDDRAFERHSARLEESYLSEATERKTCWECEEEAVMEIDGIPYCAEHGLLLIKEDDNREIVTVNGVECSPYKAEKILRMSGQL